MINWESDPIIQEVETATWHILGQLANHEILSGDADLYFYRATHDGQDPQVYRNRHGSQPHQLPPAVSDTVSNLLETEERRT